MPAALAHDDLLRRAKELDLPDQHHIDGVDEPGGGASFAVVSPRDGQVLVEVADARSAEVDLAVAAARRAFDSGPWPRLAPADRGRILLRVAELLEERREKLALTITLEMGKPFREAHDIELRAAINTFRWYGQLADKLTDESPHTAPDALALVTREPTGVVGAVVPWNFPLTLASWKVAPALAAGCTVVLKPSENSPLSALLLGRIATEAGLPPGVLNVVTGDGPTAGRAIGLHPDVDVLAFTGSTAVGFYTSCATPPTPTSSGSGWSWAASRRTSSFPTPPTWRRPPPPPPGASSSTRARCAPPPPGSWCTPPSPNASPKRSWPGPGNCASVTRWTRPPRWARWSARPTSNASSATSARASPMARDCGPVANAP